MKTKINLHDVSLGTKVRLRNNLTGELKHFTASGRYPFTVEAGQELLSYTPEGNFVLNDTHPYDIVKILGPRKKKSKIDLSTLVPGQKAKTRQGQVVVFKFRAMEPWSHYFQAEDTGEALFVRANGRFCSPSDPQEDHKQDIVEILPVESTTRQPLREHAFENHALLRSTNPDTPRTKAATVYIGGGTDSRGRMRDGHPYVPVSFAQTLERELNAALKELETLTKC